MNGEIVKIFFRLDRFHVQIKYENGTQKTMPRAIYNWLKANPSFEEVPVNYVIHHLDNDKTNDDPSNLALMQKYQHTSHHWKNKIVETPVEFDYREDRNSKRYYQPLKEPYIYHNPDLSPPFQLRFYEDIGGEKKFRRITQYQGRSFKTHEDVKWAKSQIWHSPNQIVCPLCGGSGLIEDGQIL